MWCWENPKKGMESMALSKEKLDGMTSPEAKCGGSGCGHDHDGTLYLHGRCHLGGRIEVSYTHGTGELRIGCRECGKTIAMVKVSEE